MKLFAPDVVENLWAVGFPCAISAYLFREAKTLSTEFLTALGCHFFPFLRNEGL